MSAARRARSGTLAYHVGLAWSIAAGAVRLAERSGQRPTSPSDLVRFADATATIEAAEFADIAAETLWIGRKIEEVTKVEPIVVDLSTSADFAVVKVVAPGLRFADRHAVPRPRY